MGEYQQTPAQFKSPLISERAVDEPRPLKVIYIGAGVSGILAAIHFRKYVPLLDLVIYEKNPEIGGTWYENRYPGCACGMSCESYSHCTRASTYSTSAQMSLLTSTSLAMSPGPTGPNSMLTHPRYWSTGKELQTSMMFGNTSSSVTSALRQCGTSREANG